MSSARLKLSKVTTVRNSLDGKMYRFAGSWHKNEIVLQKEKNSMRKIIKMDGVLH